MLPEPLTHVADGARAVWTYLVMPLTSTPWTAWREFWLQEVLDDRFLVVYFLPLTLVLLIAPRARLRAAIVATGLLFVAYAFGVLYALLWLLTCVGFHRLGEWLADGWQHAGGRKRGPTLTAFAIVGGWYVVTMGLHNLALPTGLNAWLWEHAPWLFPLGARGAPWEPFFSPLHNAPAAGGPFPLVQAMFWNVHSIGVAYLAVRTLAYLADIKRGALPRERRTLLNFLAYTCYAPTLIQGPLERFARFQDELDTCHTRRGWHNLPRAAGRIALGVLKSIVATCTFQPLLRDIYGIGHGGTYWLHPEQIESFALLYLGVFFIVFSLYLEFSGYCDVAAGVARLLGYRQIENFRWPWFATSLRDLWRRWHISLSEILRDYLYFPLGGSRHRATLNLCVTFLLCGLWHALTPRVAVWGLVIGLLVAVNHRWAKAMQRLDERPAGRVAAVRRAWLRLQPLPRVCGWLLTQHAFVFSLLIFFGGSGAINVVGEILRRFWRCL